MVKSSKDNSRKSSIDDLRENVRVFLNKSPIIMGIRLYVFAISIMLSGMVSRTFFGQVVAFIGINEVKETYNPQAVKVTAKQSMACARIIALITLILIMYTVCLLYTSDAADE